MNKENKENIDNLNDGKPSVDTEFSEDIKNKEVSKSLNDFQESIDEKEGANNSNVAPNENVDFNEISGEIASKVLENVDEQKEVDENSRVGNVLGEFESSTNGGKVNEFLNDIGITRKQFFIFLGIVVTFIIGVILSFYYLLSLFASGPEEIDINNQPPEEEVVVEVDEGPSLWDRFVGLFKSNDEEENDDPEVEPEEPVINVPEEDEPSVIDVGNEIGNDKPKIVNSEAIVLGYIVGVGEQADNNLSEYIRTYRELRAVFNTDLFAYLSVVEDREEAYEEYILRFKGTYQKALNAIQDLESEIDEYEVRVANVEAELENVENQFFGEVEALNSEAVPELLNIFQEIGRKEVVLTSELKARQAILDRYNNADTVVRDRITAIELNREAFIKGVRVVDYRNIDLDLIVDGQ